MVWQILELQMENNVLRESEEKVGMKEKQIEKILAEKNKKIHHLELEVTIFHWVGMYSIG